MQQIEVTKLTHLKPAKDFVLDESAIPKFPLKNFEDKPISELNKNLKALGISLPAVYMNRVINAVMDSLQPTITTASIPALIQFLQAWLPGTVAILTAARTADTIMGITMIGDFARQQVVQVQSELTGYPVPYGDQTNVPFSSFNLNYFARTIVRFEEGMEVGNLEEMRLALVNQSSQVNKRAAAALALEIVRNYVAFYGYQSGVNNTYGFLNDPGLPSYITASVVNSSTLWVNKTFAQIIADIRTMMSAILLSSGGQVNAEVTQMTMAIAHAAYVTLTTTTDLGVSVLGWVKINMPNLRIIPVPELTAANGGANVVYLFADRVNDAFSTDDGRVFIQMIADKYRLNGTEIKAKAVIESYSNATAGVWCKRPFAVCRMTGI